jgi:hypothetical protein
MKSVFRFLIFLFFIFHPSFFIINAQSLVPVRNVSFIRGEKLKFKAYYDSFVTGKVMAGIATLEVKFEDKKIDGRSTFHIVGEGKSKGAFNFFYKVNDRFESYMDEEYLAVVFYPQYT